VEQRRAAAMEGGVHEFDGSTFKECFSLSWRNPYVLRLAFSAGIGGLLFGYDTGACVIPLLRSRSIALKLQKFHGLFSSESSAERWPFCSCKSRARPFELMIILRGSGDCPHRLVDDELLKSVCQDHGQ